MAARIGVEARALLGASIPPLMLVVPNRSRLHRRLAVAALALAIGVFVAVGMFGILMPIEWGHYGHLLGEHILRARGTLRYHTMIPTQWGGPDFPPLASFYLHHGILPHHFLTVVMALFGERLWLVRLVPMSWCLVTLLAIFVVMRRHWSNRAAAAAALTYATLAYTGSFLIHYDEGLLALPPFIIAADAWLRYRERPRLHLAVAAVAGFAIGGMSEWTPYFNTAVFVPIAFFIGFSRTDSRFQRSLLLRPSQWVAFFIGLAMVVVLTFHFWFTWKVGALDDLLFAYRNRTTTPSWDWTLDRQYTWFVMYFGKPFLWLAALWLVVLFARTVALHARARDLVPFTLLAGWILQVVFFPTVVNIHSYRIYPLSAFVPLAVGALVHELPVALRWVLDRLPLLRRTSALLPAAATLAAFGWLMFHQIPIAAATVRDARRTAGTIEYEGYTPHLDMFLFAEEIRRRTPPDALLAVLPNLGVRPEFQVIADRELARPLDLSSSEALHPPNGRAVFVAWDNDWLSPGDRPAASKLVATHGAYMLDRFVLVDLSSNNPVADTWQIHTEKRTRAGRYFVSWDYPRMFARQGTRAADAAWLGSIGVRVLSPDDVPEPSHSDLHALVGYMNYLRMRGDNPAALQRAEQHLHKLTQAGPTLGPFQIARWTSSGRELRLVLSPGPTPTDNRDFRLLFTPIDEPRRAARPRELTPSRDGVPGRLAPDNQQPIQALREPVLRSASPLRTEYDLPFWKPGLLYLWEVPLREIDHGTWTVSALLYERGKAPPPSVKTPRPAPPPVTAIPRLHGAKSPPLAIPADKRKKAPEPPPPAPKPSPPPAEPLQKLPIGNVRI